MKMILNNSAVLLLPFLLVSSIQGFASIGPRRSRLSPFITHDTRTISSGAVEKGSGRLYFFWRNKEESDEGKSEQGKDKDDVEGKDKIPFIAGLIRPKDKEESRSSAGEDNDSSQVTGATTVTATLERPSVPTVPVSKPEDPVTRAEALRAQAERMKLEAERMDAELTLEKISRLERQLATAQRKGESTDEILKEMEVLQRKIRGDPPEVAPLPPVTTSMGRAKKTSDDDSPPGSGGSSLASPPSEPLAPFSQEAFDDILEEFEILPSFVKMVLARGVGLQPVGIRDINATEYALRQERMSRLDFSFLGDVVPPPEFTKEEISKFKDTFDVSKWRTEIVDRVAQSPTFQNMDEEDLIRKVMEQEYYFNEITKKFGVSASDDMNQDFMSGLRKELEKTQPYATIESIFPKCVEKEGQIPTEVQVKMLMSDVLPQAGFSPSSKPIEVFGGYLIRGESKKDNGDDLIDSIDRALLKNPMLRGKFTVTYLKDLSGVMGISDEEFEEIVFSSIPKALYVMGPEVSRPRPRGLLTAVSALGIGTSWYLSIYPFLLNPDIMNKAEEQLALADASMAYDLSWLTDLSIPLFATFMGLQAFHELGHRAVAGAYGLNITLPTFVPSLASGITSSITNFKQPAKNRQQLFDFAIAGPLVGIVASLIALYGGLLLTVNGDPTVTSTFPALPLEILRQSSLAGGFIEAVLGNGVLNVPEAARGSQVVASINIPLHPVAIAGYISLVVNSLSMLPIGVTDGGRIAQAIFNRAGKQIVGQLFLFALFAVGILGDDLFLFYAFFCLLFQQGSEIPQRNEVDDISFSRVLLATAAGVVALLSIIPMQ